MESRDVGVREEFNYGTQEKIEQWGLAVQIETTFEQMVLQLRNIKELPKPR